jgi:hypothetical protein
MLAVRVPQGHCNVPAAGVRLAWPPCCSFRMMWCSAGTVWMTTTVQPTSCASSATGHAQALVGVEPTANAIGTRARGCCHRRTSMLQRLLVVALGIEISTCGDVQDHHAGR